MHFTCYTFYCFQVPSWFCVCVSWFILCHRAWYKYSTWPVFFCCTLSSYDRHCIPHLSEDKNGMKDESVLNVAYFNCCKQQRINGLYFCYFVYLKLSTLELLTFLLFQKIRWDGKIFCSSLLRAEKCYNITRTCLFSRNPSIQEKVLEVSGQPINCFKLKKGVRD